MNGLENAQHDLNDARFSLQTAIELLDSIDHDNPAMPAQLHTVIDHLRSVQSELDLSFSELQELQQEHTH